MSGHSKWSNIKRKKEKTDAQKAKLFTKVAREITVCVRESGGDPATNGRLRDLLAKARALNVPGDNIQRLIKRAEGGERDNFETIWYEGYGPSGVAIFVESLSDNRNRTAGNMRHYFDKFGGNLGQSGSVSFLFTEKGIVLLEADSFDEEKLMEDCLAAGAEDFDLYEGVCEVTAPPKDVHEVSHALEQAGYRITSAGVEYIPGTYTALADPEDLRKLGLLLEHLEDDDDVQNVWHNLENSEDL